jgi:hypothetical protein
MRDQRRMAFTLKLEAVKTIAEHIREPDESLGLDM